MSARGGGRPRREPPNVASYAVDARSNNAPLRRTKAVLRDGVSNHPKLPPCGRCGPRLLANGGGVGGGKVGRDGLCHLARGSPLGGALKQDDEGHAVQFFRRVAEA